MDIDRRTEVEHPTAGTKRPPISTRHPGDDPTRPSAAGRRQNARHNCRKAFVVGLQGRRQAEKRP
ncbi:hypothetical protein C8Q78DRAFT_1045444 [Trametes maxima]|nr:hypothetical protein C8Q78DRAFT_1045444 [Trametes maxima]